MLYARFLGDFQYPVSSIEYPAYLNLECADLLVTTFPFVSLCFLIKGEENESVDKSSHPKDLPKDVPSAEGK